MLLEALFDLNGIVNKQNDRYWAPSRPHFEKYKEVKTPSLKVWCAVFKWGIIGPYFFEETINTNSYLERLNDWFIPKFYVTW